MRRVLAAALLATALASSGCLNPYRVHVDPDALEASGLAWVEDRHPEDSEGWLGPKIKETLYTYDSPSGGPPYAGVLQVFGLRELDARSTDALLRFTERAVEEAAEEQNIQVDEASREEGSRTLQSGLRTRWFTLEGHVASAGPLFPGDTTVRILGEVGHDGRSRTSLVAVGLAQVDEELDCPPVIPCTPARPDLRTWHDIVGDPEGSVGGATSRNGLVDHLVSHA